MKSRNKKQGGHDNELAGRDINKHIYNKCLIVNPEGETEEQLSEDLSGKEQRKKDSKSPSSLKKIYTAIFIGILVIIFGFILYETELKINFKSVKDKDNKEFSYQDTELLIFTLKPEYDITVTEFNRATQILEERVSTLASEYSFEINNDTIKITMPRTALWNQEFGEESLRYTLNLMCKSLNSEINIYYEDDEYYYENDVYIYKDDIINCEVMADRIEGPILIIYLKENAYYEAKKVLDYASNDNNNSATVNLAYRYTYHNSIKNYSEEKRAIYFENDKFQYGNLYELLLVSLSQELLPCPFEYQFDNENIITWENEDTTDLYGQFQVDYVEGISVDLFFETYNSNKESEQLWKIANETMKKRVDSLGIEFQYGYKNLGDKCVVIRLPIKYVNTGVIDLLQYEYDDFRLNYNGFNRRIQNFDYICTNDGKILLEVTLNDWQFEEILERKQTYPESDALVYIEAGDYRISSAPFYKIDGNTILFENLYFLGKDSIESDYEFIVKLLKHLYQNEVNIGLYLAYSFWCDEYHINKPEDDIFEYSLDIESDTKWNQNIKSKQQSFSDIFYVNYGTPSSDYIRFSYKHSVNSTNILDFTEAVMDIYQYLKLDESTYESIEFVFFRKEENIIRFGKTRYSPGFEVEILRFESDDSDITFETYLEELHSHDFWNQKITDYTDYKVDGIWLDD